MRVWAKVVMAVGICLLASAAGPAPTAEQDHRLMLDRLGISTLRPGVDGMNPSAINAVNYDERKAGPFGLLPDPLAFLDGGRVETAEQWWKIRRPELVELFAREEHGRVPKHVPNVTWRVVSERAGVREGVAVTERRLVGVVDNRADPTITVSLDLLVVTPRDAKAGPLVLELGFPDGAPWMRGKPAPPESDWRDQVLTKGWGYAIFDPTSAQPDNGADLRQGIIGLVNRGGPRSSDDWGALRAWAWGASRALDYLATDPAVDPHRVAIEGLSRYGKAALLTMAYDQRFAVALIASSGEGGAKLHRRRRGEQLENLASSGEYHWMAGNFLRYAGPKTVDDLPVDAHELIALVAPRPLFISAGADGADGWVDARGMFMAVVAAGPVYRLVGARGLGATTFPAPETLIDDGDLAFRQHAAGHTVGPNWPYFLAFASRYLDRP